MSAAITRANALGATTVVLPTAGNAGNAAAAYAAAAGIACQVFIPKDAKQPFIDECRLYGATVTLVDGHIVEAGRLAAEQGKPRGWYDVSTLREPGRVEGKKTITIGQLEGVSAAPEGAATFSAVRKLVEDGSIKRDETIVMFNTGGALKYLDLLR
ncbi:MAG: pyridoxal-phosphate dependent enzyme [Acidobacteriota bacterium]|nr:pyridoxal-phosphate dependent enzyme [Acidobacteriota bacterium]